ncbi:hypothetical protein, partial [Paraburkholderia oxyphila]|uniref:hypothetical protein n=1 Tax=Paraburkholderia oxyphila TaxID=614212 RepID=UPI001C3F16E0
SKPLDYLCIGKFRAIKRFTSPKQFSPNLPCASIASVRATKTQFIFQSCFISTSASIEDGRIVANARLFVPASDGSFEDDVYDLCLDENFVDENEALTFVRGRAMGWVAEHCVSST